MGSPAYRPWHAVTVLMHTVARHAMWAGAKLIMIRDTHSSSYHPSSMSHLCTQLAELCMIKQGRLCMGHVSEQVAHLLRARLVAAFHCYRDEEAVQTTELLLVTAHFLQP